MTAESPNNDENLQPFTLGRWDKIMEISQLITEHGRRVGVDTELDRPTVKDGASAAELDEFLKKQQQDNENNDKEE